MTLSQNQPRRPNSKVPVSASNNIIDVQPQQLKLGQIIALPMAVTRPDRSVSNLATPNQSSMILLLFFQTKSNNQN
jgi:hypothetical protein